MNGSYIIDPIHGSIKIPSWLKVIESEVPVRRMLFIRQLGLKAYIDFPGAIHTRYSHALGTMHLAGKIASMLAEKESKQNRSYIADILKDNYNNLVAAGFLHDIGHGPFSHTVDFVVKKLMNKTHEQLAGEILRKYLKEIENYGVSLNSLTSIISGKHRFPFIFKIINGPIDVDKLDYLLRDSYHIGLKYSFDLEHFVTTYKILGDIRQPEECELGLEDKAEAITTTEIFCLIWRSMYDLVYHIEKSRIAEKMLEKSLLLECEDNSEIKEYFANIDKYVELNDERLFELLRKGQKRSRELVDNIFRGITYNVVSEIDLEKLTKDTKVSEKLVNEIYEDENDFSDKVSIKLSEELQKGKYLAIVDVIKSKAPKPILIDRVDPKTKEPVEVNILSDIIKTMKPKVKIKVYADNNLIKEMSKNKIEKKFKGVLETW